MAELILTTGVINVDFADVTTIFRQSASSDALLGIGRSSRSAVEAVKQAVDSPLISKSLEGARGIILNLTGDKTLSLYDVDEATRYIYEHTDPEVNIILGTVIDNSLGGDVRATIIATARQGIFLIPALLILPQVLGLRGIQIAAPVSDVLTLFLAWGIVSGILRQLKAKPDRG